MFARVICRTVAVLMLAPWSLPAMAPRKEANRSQARSRSPAQAGRPSSSEHINSDNLGGVLHRGATKNVLIM